MLDEGYWVEIPTYQCALCRKFETDDCEYVELNKNKDCVNYVW